MCWDGLGWIGLAGWLAPGSRAWAGLGWNKLGWVKSLAIWDPANNASMLYFALLIREQPPRRRITCQGQPRQHMIHKMICQCVNLVGTRRSSILWVWSRMGHHHGLMHEQCCRQRQTNTNNAMGSRQNMYPWKSLRNAKFRGQPRRPSFPSTRRAYNQPGWNTIQHKQWVRYHV